MKNKASINFLCVLIIAILTASVLLPAYYLGETFGKGFAAGYTSSKTDCDMSQMQSLSINFEPEADILLSPQDSVTFDDGRRYPMIVRQASVLVESGEMPPYINWVNISCFIVSIIAFIFLLIYFIKFIVKINRGEVFVLKNVKYLRWISLFLIIISVSQVIDGVCNEYAVGRQNLTLAGYSLSAYWFIPWSNILLGLLSLLVAQVWRRGLEMEEEQKLTV